MDAPTRVCILGGGFGGLYTALNLSAFPWEPGEKPQVTLIDQADHFLFTPLLYELVTGELQSWEVAPPFEELLAGTGIAFCQGTVESVDLDQRRVLLAAGRELAYDALVLAAGGETPRNQVPGAAEYALPFRTLADANHLREHLRQLESQAQEMLRVIVVGAGPSGIELACKLADRLAQRGRVRLVDRGDQVLKAFSSFHRDLALKALESRGVWVDLETDVISVDQGSITLDYKGQVDTLPVDLVLWTVGTQPRPWVLDLPAGRNERGQLLTLPTLQLVDYPEVFALGDMADTRDARGKRVPTTAQAAFQAADYAAWNLWASLTGRPLLPFRYLHLGEMIALGSDGAAISAMGVNLKGPAAYVTRRLVYLLRMPTLRHRLQVGWNWVAGPVVEWLAQT